MKTSSNSKKILFRTIIIAVIAIVCIIILGIRTNLSKNTPDEETLEDGSTVTHEESGDTYNMVSLNGSMMYEDSEFHINDISFYEDVDNFEYTMWAVLELDLAQMDDESLHWFLNDDTDFHVNFYVDNEKNGFDSKRASTRATSLYDNETLMIAFNLSGYRYSLSGSEYNLQISFNNGGTYKSKGSFTELDKEDTYYFFNLIIPENLPSVETMEQTYYNDIVDSLDNTLKTMTESSSSSNDTSKTETTNTATPTASASEAQSNGYTYQSILDIYTEAMAEMTPLLIAAYNSESSSLAGDVNSLAELCNEKVSELAEMCNDGISEMAELMMKNGDDYSTYEEWAGKLQDVYMEYAGQIQDAYMASAN